MRVLGNFYSLNMVRFFINSAKKGFTLIELSIVLIILGLISGAVVGAGQLILAAKVVGASSEINRFVSSVALFNSQYVSLPGDFSDAAGQIGVAATSNGNGDGKIDGSRTGSITMNYNEGIEAWYHLNASGVLTGKVASCTSACTATILTGTNQNVPVSKLTNTGYLMLNGGLVGLDASKNYLTIGGASTTLTSPAATIVATIPGKIARGIDKKFDSAEDGTNGTVKAITGTLSSSAFVDATNYALAVELGL